MIVTCIPTLNNASDLDATVQSVFSQNYDRGKIFICFLDFGSTDGTIDRILGYEKENVGFYEISGKQPDRTAIAEAARMAGSIGAGRFIYLLPGDVLYPHCFETIRKHEYPARCLSFYQFQCIAELDVRSEDGAVHKRNPLFDASCILPGDVAGGVEYVRHGYRRNIFSFGVPFSNGRDTGATHFNARTWWNSLACIGLNTCTVYVNESVGCFRERICEDELNELVFRFGIGIAHTRFVESAPSLFTVNDDVRRFDVGYRRQLAYHALWRAWLLRKRGNLRQAEDCYLFSRVIHLPIEGEDCFAHTRLLIEKEDGSSAAWLEEYYSQDEKTLPAKHPLRDFPVFSMPPIQQRFLS